VINRYRNRAGPLVLLLVTGIPQFVAGGADSTAKPETGFVALFNGKDLTGWEGDTNLWKARDGMLVGDSPGIRYNDFLAAANTYGDFILKFSFRLVKNAGNSGVQYRSQRVPNSHEVSGYQAEIAGTQTGSLYDESRRNRFLMDARPAGSEKVMRVDGWNDYMIRCEGDHIVQELNGLKVVDYRETDPGIARSGIIALQIHGGGPMEIQFKNIRIKRLGK
jgi:3-keto-disaccharide hydrolase